jgi:quercetin dioxygenase-like cupin family protein
MNASDLRNQILDLRKLVEYGAGAVVSRTLLDSPAGTLTVFAFDEGQGLSEHTAPYDATILVIEGEGELTVGGVLHKVLAGELLIMPANMPHSVRARQRFKMLLIMIRGRTTG